jgi:hypothetical protein
MNDLERDLRELFDSKATRIDVPPAAPEAVLRRARRRQVGVGVAGALGAAAVIALAAGITVSMLDDTPTEHLPAGPSAPYGDRTSVIEHYEVTAPEGWTLLDAWPLASVMSTDSQSCTATFSSVGTPVEGGGGGAGDAGQAGAAAQDVSSDPGTCTTEPAELPAGLPVLQLSTFQHGPISLACDAFTGFSEDAHTTLPNDGVAVYVTSFPEVLDPADVSSRLQESCAATPDIVAIVQGPSMTWVTAIVAGSEADPSLLAQAKYAVRDLGGHDTDEPAPAPVLGIGYVIASGTTGGERWQITAGAQLEEGIPWAWMTSHDASGAVTGTLEQPWRKVGAPVASSIDVGDAAVALGLVPAPGGAATWAMADGTAVDLLQVPFPSAIAADGDIQAFDGTVAYGQVPGTDGTLLVNGVVETPPSPAPTPSAVPVGQALDVTVRKGVATGTIDAFGRTIAITVDRDGIVQVPDERDSATSLIRNSGTRVDLEGGSLALSRLRADAQAPYVIADDGTVYAGSWIEVPASVASPDKVWIVPLEGSGAGMEYEAGRLGSAITWPMHEDLLPGDVPVAGAQDGMTSWAFRWSADDCPVFEVVDAVNPANLGTMADCIPPYDPSVTPTYVGGIYGEDVATIAVTGPLGFFFRTDGEAIVQCGTDFSEPGWEDTGVCVVVMQTGISVEFQATDEEQGGRPIGEPVTLRVEGGELTIS